MVWRAPGGRCGVDHTVTTATETATATAYATKTATATETATAGGGQGGVQLVQLEQAEDNHSTPQQE